MERTSKSNSNFALHPSYFATPILGQTVFSEQRSHWGFRAEQTLRP